MVRSNDDGDRATRHSTQIWKAARLEQTPCLSLVTPLTESLQDGE
jgi:hypothetical protein